MATKTKRLSQKRTHHKALTVQQKLDHIMQMLNVDLRRAKKEIVLLKKKLGLA